MFAVGLTLAAVPSARANVYATNIKLDGGTTNISATAGDVVQISYVLNEPASLGLTINILSGSNVVATIPVAASESGAQRGLNTVNWDTTGAGSGTYTISITARSSGYAYWTHLTSDTDPSTYVWDGRGIAVDQNPGSLYYGRVFIANADTGSNPANTPGDVNGILKFNADDSFADEGAASGGHDGYNWSGLGLSPWKLAVSQDDLVYVDDMGGGGVVLRWDPLISSNSLFPVLRSDNRPAGAHLSGPAIAGTGTNTQVWMADNQSSFGILKWIVTTNGACATNDLGKTVVGIGGDLTQSPYAVALDKFGNIYTCQYISTPGATPRVFRFPAYDPATNGGMPELTADWSAGANDDGFASASGLAVDPTGTYLAVAFQGSPTTGAPINGGAKILYATNGVLVTNIDLAINGFPNQDTDCAWDAAGNLYYNDYYALSWRAVSPPGTNQATTVAVPMVQLGGGQQLPPPQVTQITSSNGVITIDFTALPTDSASSFSVVGASVPTGPYLAVSGATITQLSPGVFRATLPATGSEQFFRIARQGSSAPPQPFITGLSLSGGNVILTFTGSSSDSPSAFTLLSATVPGGPYAPAASASITQLSPGVFKASVPANGPAQFYRVQR